MGTDYMVRQRVRTISDVSTKSESMSGYANTQVYRMQLPRSAEHAVVPMRVVPCTTPTRRSRIWQTHVLQGHADGWDTWS